jgi:hypothetical protein
MTALRDDYFWGLPDEPYHWELEVSGRFLTGRILSTPGSANPCRRISAALVACDIAERQGQINTVALARLRTELQGT